LSLHEQTVTEFRFHLVQDRLAQKIAFWEQGDPPITITPEQELRALKTYVVATSKALFFLADRLDRLEIAGSETEE
jgi:hypothetical protein